MKTCGRKTLAIRSLLPGAITWAEARSDEILGAGAPLSDVGMRLARTVGVECPERIRISTVNSIPLPGDFELRTAALETGLIGPGTAGMTLGYGIYILDGCESHRLISHECRHVYQYEQAGSIKAFLPHYLRQIAEFGYDNAPYELDAREHEIEIA